MKGREKTIRVSVRRPSLNKTATSKLMRESYRTNNFYGQQDSAQRGQIYNLSHLDDYQLIENPNNASGIALGVGVLDDTRTTNTRSQTNRTFSTGRIVPLTIQNVKKLEKLTKKDKKAEGEKDGLKDDFSNVQVNQRVEAQKPSPQKVADIDSQENDQVLNQEN